MFYQFGPLITLPTCCMASEITKIISASLQSSICDEGFIMLCAQHFTTTEVKSALLCLREKHPPINTILTLNRTVC